MTRGAQLFAALIGCLAVAALAPAGAVVLPASVTAAAPASIGGPPTAFSFSYAAPGAHQIQRARPAATPQPSWQPRWFGYPSARADELPPPAPRPAMLFAHAALGVAALDSAAGGDAVAVADGGQLAPGQMRLLVSAAPDTGFPRPLPIALILMLVLLPAGLVLAQALRGPPRRPLPAMRRPVARRRDGEG